MALQPTRYTKVSSTNKDDWSGHWFDQIGWVGYYFGQMEWTPYLLGERVGCSKKNQTKMRNMTFSERCKFAKAELTSTLDPTLQQEWRGVLDEISKCGAMRNTILHNPLELNVDEINAHGIKINQGILMLKRGGTVLTLGDVQQYTTTMVDLHKRVIELLSRTPNTPSKSSQAVTANPASIASSGQP